MISKALISRENIFKSPKSVRISTANGIVDVTERAYCSIPSLGITVEAILLKSTPPALSLGRLIESGYLFHWTRRGVVMTNPDGVEFEVEVVNKVPYIYATEEYGIAAEK